MSPNISSVKELNWIGEITRVGLHYTDAAFKVVILMSPNISSVKELR